MIYEVKDKEGKEEGVMIFESTQKKIYLSDSEVKEFQAQVDYWIDLNDYLRKAQA